MRNAFLSFQRKLESRSGFQIKFGMTLVLIVSSFLLVTWLFSPAYAFSFAVLGDNRDGEQTYIRLLNQINSDKQISFIFNTGDFVSHGAAFEYQQYQKILKENNKLPIYHVLGNHDGVYGGWRQFGKIFGPSYYSFNYDNSHFVVLDNAFKNDFDKKQENWLLSDLKNNNQKRTFVFFHKPIFDATGTGSDHLIDSRRVGEKMMGIFKKYKVAYVICGHVHGYARAERDNIVYIITGGGGAPLALPSYLGGFNHYVKISVDGEKISEKVVRLDD